MRLTEFIRRIYMASHGHSGALPNAESKFAFFLGAGCSVSSGIPSAGELVRNHWLPRLFGLQKADEADVATFANRRFPNYAPEQASASYGDVMDAVFETANARQLEIEALCDGRFPGFGYAALAKLVAHSSSAFNVVLTTNFDDLMADAQYLYTEARPLVIHHESLAAFIRPTRMRPLVVKLHGDHRLSPKNTISETANLDRSLAKHIAMLLNDRGLIFLGYGGADQSILKLLSELPAEAVPSGVYWLSQSAPTGDVATWLAARDGQWVPITDFDEAMVQVYDQFGFAHPSKAEFDKMFGKYFETFAKVADRIGQGRTTSTDGDLVIALESVRNKLPEDFGEVSRGAALAADKPKEAQEVLEAVARRPGVSVGAQVTAAKALRDRLYKYDESIRALEAALQLAIKESGDQSEEAVTVRAELAWSLWLVGNQRKAEDTIAAVIAWFEAQAPRDERALAIHYATRARIRQDCGDLGGAEEDIVRSITWGEAQAPRDERTLAVHYATRASIRQERGDLAGAEEDIARSITWGETQTPRADRSLAIRYATRAGIRRDRGDLVGAEEDIARSIAWGEAQAPRDERALAIDYTERADLRHARGDLAGAEEDIARSLAWFEAQAPRDERALAIDYAARARIRQDRGDLVGAEEDIGRGIAWGEAQTPRPERSLAIDYATRAGIRQDRGDLVGAEEDIARTIAWFETNLPGHLQRVAINYRLQARILAAAAKWPEAQASINRAVRAYEDTFGKEHVWTKKARVWRRAIDSRSVPPRWIDTQPE